MKFTFLLIVIHSFFLSQAQQPKLILPIGHTKRINSVQFSADGKSIVTASDDGSAKLWNAETGILLANFTGHKNIVWFAGFSPDGKKIITASNDFTAKIWDIETGALLLDLSHEHPVYWALFSPDGKKIMTTAGITVKIWNAETGALLKDFEAAEYNGRPHNFITPIFSNDGKKILTISEDYTDRVWNAETGFLLVDLKAITNEEVQSAIFSGDSKKILTISKKNIPMVWNAETGALLTDLSSHLNTVLSADFSPNGKRIVTVSGDNTIKVWNTETGSVIVNLKIYRDSVISAIFSRDGKKILTTSIKNITTEWNAETGVLLGKLKEGDLKGNTGIIRIAHYSPDGKKIVTISDNDFISGHYFMAKVWNAETGFLLANLKGHTQSVNSAVFSSDGKKILSTLIDNTIKVWNTETGTLLLNLKAPIIEEEFESLDKISAFFSPDGKIILSASSDSVRVWNAETGKLLFDLPTKNYSILNNPAIFSPNGKKIVLPSWWDSTARVWNAETGTLLVTLSGHTGYVISAFFSPDGKMIVTASSDSTAKIWNTETGALLMNLKHPTKSVETAIFFPSKKKILTVSSDSTARIWNIETGALLVKLKNLTKDNFNWENISALFSSDEKKVLTTSWNSQKVWNVETGDLLMDLKSSSARFSQDGNIVTQSFFDDTLRTFEPITGRTINLIEVGSKYLANLDIINKRFIGSENSVISLFDLETGRKLRSMLAVDSNDYLVYDDFGHYDGTSAARKLLYYTCGTEVIGLEQVKDKLWVRNLAERINKGEKINAPTLSELNICGLTPEVEPLENKTGYKFKISPRRGGLGETSLSVNGIERKRYKPDALKKTEDGYELLVAKEELNKFFAAGMKNDVTVIAYIKENDISSRGATINNEDAVKNTSPPNLYAVIIGVSDYKGNELHLNYAAKDAADIGNAVKMSAGKFLGKEHVFVYNLNTSNEHYAYPEKKSIKDVFTEISKKATSNDILMVFFAGHGVVKGDQKQFYFLTADASNATINDKDVKDVGISAAELMEWMKPDNIKAQKRILILDACQSGQAIKQMVGDVAARDDDKAETIKQIDKLNEKAGLYILAASASNQSAYELGRFNQGLLTYALLKVIKEHPEVLEQNKYLNVSGWFNKATQLVNDIVRESNLRQEPQLITTTNFNVGIVDKDVLAGIVLPDEKAMFAASNFQNNDAAVMDDDLGLTAFVNKRLGIISSRSLDSKITFINTSSSPEAWLLIGRYDVKADDIIVRVNLKQNNEVKNKFEIQGKKSNLQELAEQLINKAIELIGLRK